MTEVTLRNSSGPVLCKHWEKVPECFGSPPECAFNKDGSFNPDNWNCGLMDKLRDAAHENEVWSEDEHMAIIPYPNQLKFGILAYYKSRGRTDRFWIWEVGKEIREGIQADAEQFVKLRQKGVE